MSDIVKKCECGYEPKKDYDAKSLPRECSAANALCNHITFPSVTLTPKGFFGDYNCNYNLYCDKKKNSINYWVTLIELDQEVPSHSIFPCSDWIGHDRFGELVKIMVYKDCQSESELPRLFKFSDFQKGNTIAVFQPTRECGSIVLNYTNFDNCLVFKTSMKNVYAEAKCLLYNADSKTNNDLLECHTCGLRCANLSGCSKCKLARYCSKECQIKGWNLSHKVLCSHSDMLLRLASLPRHKYVDDYQNFNRNFPSYKPPTSVPKTNNDSRVFKSLNQQIKSDNSTSIDDFITMLKKIEVINKFNKLNRSNIQNKP